MELKIQVALQAVLPTVTLGRLPRSSSLGGAGAFTTTSQGVSIALSLGFSRTGDQCQEGFSGWRNLASGLGALMGTWWLLFPPNPFGGPGQQELGFLSLLPEKPTGQRSGG